MVARELLDPDGSLWHWIAADLHFYRAKHKMTLDQLGEVMSLKKAAVSNLEAARPGFRLQQRQAEALDTLWGLNGHFSRLLRYAHRMHSPEWFRDFTELEKHANKIKLYEVALVPGLLQTEGYARTLLSSGPVVNVDRAVSARLTRQKILTSDNPPELWVLLNQSALEQPVGGPEIMRGQLQHLLDCTQRHNTIIRVVPRSIGAHMGLDGAFSIIYTKKTRAAYMDAIGGGRLSDDPAVVDEHELCFDRIGADALSRESTRQMITKQIEAMS